jgi:hypothetical protein
MEPLKSQLYRGTYELELADELSVSREVVMFRIAFFAFFVCVMAVLAQTAGAFY